jgi:putative PIN family toxin of toxin-antitoxin system
MHVLDSNVIVSGLFSRRGASFWLLERAISGQLAIAISVALALEYEDVLFRQDSLVRSWAETNQIDAVLDALLAGAKLVQPIRFRQRPALPDPGDDPVLECALQAQASAIVTTNVRDFSAVEATYGLKVMKPGELVAKLRREES